VKLERLVNRQPRRGAKIGCQSECKCTQLQAGNCELPTHVEKVLNFAGPEGSATGVETGPEVEAEEKPPGCTLLMPEQGGSKKIRYDVSREPLPGAFPDRANEIVLGSGALNSE
jgi:hypothetical protein